MRLGQAIIDVCRAARVLARPAGGTLAALVLVAACSSSTDQGSEKTGEAVEHLNGIGSNFEDTDGNLVVNTGGNEDWVNAPSFQSKNDKPSGTGDDSFGQGTKEDSPVPTVVSGSIPPNKSDLTRFYVSHEQFNGQFFLYLAWERSNVLGSANMDFEFNQSSTLSGNGVTPVRSAGDMLITFDFVNGGSKPVLGLLRWVTSGPTSQCFASNALPCWGNRVDLSAAGFAEGAVNAGTVTDPIAGVTLPGLTFGEAGINLTAAGVFPAGQCVNFASAYLKSRSSASFTAELKDFIAPANANIRNCGQIILRKVTSPSPDPTNTTFNYTTTGALTPATFTLQNGGTRDYGNQVQAGSYTVTETNPGSGFSLTGISCSASSLTNGSTVTTNVATGTVSITLKPDDTVDCTYTNTLQRGAIRVTKLSTKNQSALSGATFAVKDSSNNTVGTITTGSDGTACIENLSFGSYTVTETSAPSGYAIDNPSPVSVSVDHTASCSSGTPNTPASAFTDTPLSRITVSFQSLAGPGVTTATIQCTGDASAQSLPEGSPRVLDQLAPGSYTCTVVVDP